jgi:D-mannonate dehydratase
MEIHGFRDTPSFRDSPNNAVDKALADLQILDADLKQMAQDCGNSDAEWNDFKKFMQDYMRTLNEIRAANTAGQLPDDVEAKIETEMQTLDQVMCQLSDICKDPSKSQEAMDYYLNSVSPVLADIDVALEPYATPPHTSH